MDIKLLKNIIVSIMCTNEWFANPAQNQQERKGGWPKGGLTAKQVSLQCLLLKKKQLRIICQN